MLYNIVGVFSIFVIEDIENEIGLFERKRSFDVSESLFTSSKYDIETLDAVVGKFRNECYVEPDKWTVKLETVNLTIGKRQVVTISANDLFDSEGYALGYTPGEYDKYVDGEYFTEQQYTAHILREGWKDATEDDVLLIRDIISGYAIDEREVEEYAELNEYEDYVEE